MRFDASGHKEVLKLWTYLLGARPLFNDFILVVFQVPRSRRIEVSHNTNEVVASSSNAKPHSGEGSIAKLQPVLLVAVMSPPG
jgi:hypothetical protein